MLIRSFAAARLVFAVLAIFVLSASANAAAYITFVASNGNDANPCTVVTAPCKTLARVYSVTTANGTIRVLTPLQGNLSIAKNVTIEGDGATIVGTIVINNANAVVTLRGLALNGAKAYATGINITTAAAVHIENCTVERYTGDGIRMVNTSHSGKLFVSDTVSRDNGATGLYVYDLAVDVSVENSRFENIAAGYGLFLRAARANVTRSTASGNENGIYTSGLKTIFTETTAANNSSTGIIIGSGSATLASSAFSDNYYGLVLNTSSASVTITDSVFTNNAVGIVNYGGAAVISDSVITSNIVAINNAGTLHTRQNNTLGGSYSGAAAIPYAAF